MPEFIQDGVNGFLLKEMTVDKYAHRLRWFRTNQKRMFEMGQAARATITSWWTWKSVVNKHERKAFRRVIDGL
jgi:glycosyltransferase involved in cell wall biosynthesis